MRPLALFSVLVPLALYSCDQVFAQNVDGQYDDSPYKTWFANQYSATDDALMQPQQGNWCCNLADGHPYLGNYTQNADGSVTLDGTPDVHIDAFKVLTGETVTFPVTNAAGTVTTMTRGGPNPTGHAIVWSNATDLGNRATYIYCFSPGPLT